MYVSSDLCCFFVYRGFWLIGSNTLLTCEANVLSWSFNTALDKNITDVSLTHSEDIRLPWHNEFSLYFFPTSLLLCWKRHYKVWPYYLFNIIYIWECYFLYNQSGVFLWLIRHHSVCLIYSSEKFQSGYYKHYS